MLDRCVYFAISSLSARVRSLGKLYATFSRLREFALHFLTNLVCTKKGRPRGWGGGGGTLGNSWWRCAVRFSKSWPYFRPKKFSDLAFIIHTRYQTWPPRNCIMLERQQRVFKSVLNSHITFSFLFIWNWNYQYVHTLPQKLYPFSDRNGTKTLPSTLWGGKYLYGLHKRVHLPPGGGGGAQNGWESSLPSLIQNYCWPFLLGSSDSYKQGRPCP